MKIRYLILLISIIIAFKYDCKGQQNKQSSDIEIRILETELNLNKDFKNLILEPEFKKIRYSIMNNSSTTYAIVIDTVNFYMYSNAEFADRWGKINNDISDKQLFKIGLNISTDKNKFHGIGYNIFTNYFENLPSLSKVINSDGAIIILKPKEKIVRQLQFSFPTIINETENGGLAHFYLLNDPPEYFNIFIFQNKDLIDHNLNVKNRKKLKRNQAQIFSGTITSNKIPVKLE